MNRFERVDRPFELRLIDGTLADEQGRAIGDPDEEIFSAPVHLAGSEIMRRNPKKIAVCAMPASIASLQVKLMESTLSSSINFRASLRGSMRLQKLVLEEFAQLE